MNNMIQNNSLSDQIWSLLKDSIIKGDLKPGDRLLELELAKTYNVSQAPIREALFRLKKEGFVVHYRNKGTFVSNFSNKNIEEVYSFREIMEPFAISKAIKNLKDEDLKKLESLYQKMLVAGKDNNLEGIRQTDLAFHNYIYNLADHNFMFEIWKDLSAVSDRIWYLTSQVYFNNLEEIAKLHKPILDAMYERNEEKCVEAFKIHLHYVWEKIKSDEISK